MRIRRIEPRASIKRVAAYARVSTLNEEQIESYETQKNYYSQLICSTEGWTLVGIYADRGITGTSANKRSQFMQMINDASEGKIDLILCKSISRFSRNLMEAQKYVHYLKSIRVEIRFEKEGISSFDPSADMIFSVMAAMAQEESRSISDNLKWSFRRLAERGIRHVGNNHLLGYDEINGKLTPNKDAWIVELIFKEYAAGYPTSQILRHLKERGARRLRSSRDFRWSAALSIIKNECYVGDRLLQKTAPVNFLTKKPDFTEPYTSKYLYNDHEGIISREIWDSAQERLKRQRKYLEKGMRTQYNTHFLYGKVFCSKCGQPCYRVRIPNGDNCDAYWRCRKRIKTGECRNRSIKESNLLSEISKAFGLKWEKNMSFNESAILESLEKVLISESGIEIIKTKYTDNTVTS